MCSKVGPDRVLLRVFDSSQRQVHGASVGVLGGDPYRGLEKTSTPKCDVYFEGRRVSKRNASTMIEDAIGTRMLVFPSKPNKVLHGAPRLDARSIG